MTFCECNLNFTPATVLRLIHRHPTDLCEAGV